MPTPADLQKQTAEYLKPDQTTIVGVGDRAKMSEPLAPFAPGTK